MGFDTMRSFQHLGLLSKPRGLDVAASVNDGLRRQDSFMFASSAVSRQVMGRKGLRKKCLLTTSRSNDCCSANTSSNKLPVQQHKLASISVYPPSFQTAKAKWSPPPSPGSSSPTSPVGSPRSPSTHTVTLSAKEKNALANQLYAAACSGDLGAIEDLLHRGAPINSSVLVGGLFEAFKPAKAGHLSPLAGAATCGQYDAAELLLSHGAELNPDSQQCACSPLHQAIRNNDFELVRFFLERGADVDIDNSYKTTPIMYASKYSSPELVSLLLEYAPDLNKLSFINAAAIHWSVWPGNAKVTELLLMAGANPNHPMADGSSPLSCAILTGSVSMVKCLLRFGADPLQRNDEYETPLQIAHSQSDSEEILKLLKAAVAARR
ncbi:Palmitoyltransferase AKR1 [Lecanosticta acicola]|uniref:Palmitoyltransferase AKR1 n=1 Tax=Lecanosticta acicola TaxID=111012 RepID=A0AAI9EA85_9PEZI|nr:Palmitoyltransferase AKR1 [Lecanosticta acicola]